MTGSMLLPGSAERQTPGQLLAQVWPSGCRSGSSWGSLLRRAAPEPGPGPARGWERPPHLLTAEESALSRSGEGLASPSPSAMDRCPERRPGSRSWPWSLPATRGQRSRQASRRSRRSRRDTAISSYDSPPPQLQGWDPRPIDGGRRGPQIGSIRIGCLSSEATPYQTAQPAALFGRESQSSRQKGRERLRPLLRGGDERAGRGSARERLREQVKLAVLPVQLAYLAATRLDFDPGVFDPR